MLLLNCSRIHTITAKTNKFRKSYECVSNLMYLKELSTITRIEVFVRLSIYYMIEKITNATVLICSVLMFFKLQIDNKFARPQPLSVKCILTVLNTYH